MNKILINIFISASIITFYSVNIAIAEIHKMGIGNLKRSESKIPSEMTLQKYKLYENRFFEVR